MKKRIIITETDDMVEIDKFLIDSNGDIHKTDDIDDQINLHYLFHMAIHQDKRNMINKKKKKKHDS